MHDSLTKHAAQLARLAMMIRIGLESAESAIPGINDLSLELRPGGRPTGWSAFENIHKLFKTLHDELSRIDVRSL